MAELDNSVADALSRERGDVFLTRPFAVAVAVIAFCWALFQLWIASPLPFMLGLPIASGISARGIHLGFALALCFLSFTPFARRAVGAYRPSFISLLIGVFAVFAALYVWLNYTSISERAGQVARADIFGVSVPYEAVIGWVGLIALLEATRRSIGLPLAIVAAVFLVYSYLGPYMPDLISHKGVSLTGLANYQWLTDQGVFGIPIDVAVRFIFLFVVFGALLDRAGAGQFFMDLALALVGKYRGGPAKAAVLASGMTGMVSGSSIANTVTTGTFTIPLMKRTGLSAERAGAIEVAASVNGQIMPPIMGAAAFVMAELLAISYFDVIYHAFIPAVISYIALFYIADLEAQRLGLKPIKNGEGVSALSLLRQHGYYLFPLVLLIYLLVWARMTTGSAVFWAIIFLMGILLVREVMRSRGNILAGLADGGRLIVEGIIQGAKNMISVAIALAAAGIIVGAVGQSGLSNALTGIVETLAFGNIYLLLLLVALLSLILGMGLPTTANYLVVATLMVPVIAKVGATVGLEVPLIAAHLFVFYFGLMADVTPPVALSAYAAAGISKGDPLKTGFQAFFYSIRTAILPFVFIFNLDLLLLDVHSFAEVVLIFVSSLTAILVFTSLTFRWMFTRLKLFEMLVLAVACVLLFHPGVVMDRIADSYLSQAPKTLVTGVQADAVKVQAKLLRSQETKWLTLKKPTAVPTRVPTDKDDVGGELFKAAQLGLTLRDDGPRGLVVAAVKFNGPAHKAGLNFGDVILKLKVANPDRLSKRWLYLPGFILVLFVGLFNWRRRETS
ncbi:MAG: C4-dicarboxylate ABC transporter [Rhodomicrobium sp.]|nr:MAG: C4-dicarboxylate ABC transporter [Rhodomicrobium sp.]